MTQEIHHWDLRLSPALQQVTPCLCHNKAHQPPVSKFGESSTTLAQLREWMTEFYKRLRLEDKEPNPVKRGRCAEHPPDEIYF